MKGIQLTTPGQYRLRTDLKVPEPAPGEVRLKVAAAGICGTDVHICSGDPSMDALIAPPVTLGHEFCGHIDKLGDGVDESQYPLGTYASAEMHEVCGVCGCERRRRSAGRVAFHHQLVLREVLREDHQAEHRSARLRERDVAKSPVSVELKSEEEAAASRPVAMAVEPDTPKKDGPRRRGWWSRGKS